MGVVKIGISLPRPLLERALAEEVPPRVLAEARALYAAIEEDDRAMAEDFLAVVAENLPPYEEVRS